MSTPMVVNILPATELNMPSTKKVIVPSLYPPISPISL